MDTLHIRDLRISTKIGITDAERIHAQELLVSIWMETSIRDVAHDDALMKGIDYAAVSKAIEDLGHTERRTIERFAEDTAKILLEEFKPHSVSVSIEKHPADIACAAACITIQRP